MEKNKGLDLWTHADWMNIFFRLLDSFPRTFGRVNSKWRKKDHKQSLNHLLWTSELELTDHAASLVIAFEHAVRLVVLWVQPVRNGHRTYRSCMSCQE